jgi:hypothetical protein
MGAKEIMNDKDAQQIWESHVSENRDSNKYNEILAQVKDLIRQKTEYYANIDPQSAFDVSIEDLESQYSEVGDSEAMAILNDISTKKSLNHEESEGFRPSNGAHLKPIEQKIPSQEEIVDMVQYYRSEQGKSKWEDFKRFVEMSGPDWSNTMSYLMTNKGPGDYGDRLD